jgi:hemin uptake protein HemP
MNAQAFPHHLRPDPRPLLRLPQGAPDLPTHDARRLTGPGGVACILLDGQAYVLRITRQGKLILTK